MLELVGGFLERFVAYQSGQDVSAIERPFARYRQSRGGEDGRQDVERPDGSVTDYTPFNPTRPRDDELDANAPFGVCGADPGPTARSVFTSLRRRAPGWTNRGVIAS